MEDDLPDKAFRLLIFLFRISDCAGCARADYPTMKRGASIGSDATVAESIRLLKKHGWFHFIKKGGGKPSVYFLRIPPRFSETDHGALKVRMFPRAI